MIKKSTFLLVLTFLSFWVNAQNITVTGKVTATNNSRVLEGVSVTIKGTNNGTFTNSEGAYSLTAPSTGTLVFSAVGFAAVEIPIKGQATHDVSLKEVVGQMEEVVVTALGVNRQKRSLGYASQQVSGADLQTGRENNLANALQGRVAGLVVNKSSAGVGSSTRITLRGERSILGGNQPLIVIDGVAVDNTTRGVTGEFNGSDGGDAIGNLSPDDIESMNVLRGANAAALYGARANNGVLIITTKKGRKQKGIGVSVFSNTYTETPSYKQALQSQYAQGSNITTYASGSDESWGPKITGQNITNWKGDTYAAAPQDHIDAFFQKAVTTNNGISLSTGNNLAQIRISYNNLLAKGLVPNNKQVRDNFIVRASTDFGKFNADVKVNYIVQKITNRPNGGEESANPYSDILRMPSSVRNSDLQNYIDNSGALVRNSFYAPNSAIIGNPYWMVNKLNPVEIRNRMIISTTLKYKLTNDINITGRLGLDRYNDDNDRKVYAGTPTPLTGNTSVSGDYQVSKFNLQELNLELFADYSTKLSDIFSFNALLGTSLRKNKSEGVNNSAGGLDLPDLFILNNNKVAPTSSNFFSQQEIQSVFTTAQVGYKNALFLDLTARNDWSSTLPKANRSFFYPSASISAIISELTKLPDFFDYVKLRTSYAFVGKEAGAYAFAQLLRASAGPSGTVLANSPILVNPDLKPEQTRSFEIGTELRFWRNKLALDFTYYKTNSINQILNISLPVSTGFTAKQINAGNIQNSGIEILLSANVLKQKAFSWDVAINYGSNKNKVIKLDDVVKKNIIGSNRIVDIRSNEGERVGDLYGNNLLRDAEGNVQIAASGLPIIVGGKTKKLGSISPDWTGGINNTLRYKNFSFDFLIDGRFGGVVASHTQAVLAGLGKLENTLEGRDANSYIVPGVLQGTKTPNNIAINPKSYWQLVGGRGAPVGELWVYDATAIRMRQMTLGYKIGGNKLGKSGIQGIDVSLYGRNLFFLKNKAPFDPEVTLNTGLGGQGLDFYSLPTTRSLGISFNISF
jgi:TonB-linked SusC/RagA family outer membrane protein